MTSSTQDYSLCNRQVSLQTLRITGNVSLLGINWVGLIPQAFQSFYFQNVTSSRIKQGIG